MTKLRALSAACAGMALFLNLLIENILMGVKERAVLIPNLLDFAPTWNRGVSFSLFWQDGNSGQYALIAILAVIIVGVGVMAWRASNGLAAIGYGLIIGGALGNLLDRSQYLAVFDYLFLHLGHRPLFVFNFPDAVISIAVLFLIADSLVGAKTASPSRAS